MKERLYQWLFKFEFMRALRRHRRRTTGRGGSFNEAPTLRSKCRVQEEAARAGISVYDM